MISLEYRNTMNKGDGSFGFQKETIPTDLLNVEINDENEKEFLQAEVNKLEEVLSLRKIENNLRVEAGFRIIGQILSRNCEKFRSLSRNSGSNGTEIEAIKSFILRIVNFIDEFIGALNRIGITFYTNEFFRRTTVFDLINSSDDFGFNVKVAAAMYKATQKTNSSYLNNEEQRNLNINTRGFLGNQGSLFTSYANLFKLDSNYKSFKSKVPAFEDTSEKWVEDRLETFYFSQNEKNESVLENILIERLSEIPENISTEKFWLNFIEENNLKSKFLYEKKEYSLYFYIILNKIKFKRAAILYQHSKSEYNEFLLKYASLLALIQQSGSNWQYYAGYSEFPDDANLALNTDWLRRLLIMCLNIDNNFSILLKLFDPIISSLADDDIPFERIKVILEKCGPNELTFKAKIICQYLMRDIKSTTMFELFKESLMNLWVEYENNKPILLHAFLSTDYFLGYAVKSPGFPFKAFSEKMCKALEETISQAVGWTPMTISQRKMQEIFRLFSSCSINDLSDADSNIKLVPNTKRGEIYTVKLLETVEKALPNILVIEAFVHITSKLAPEDFMTQNSELAEKTISIIRQLYDKKFAVSDDVFIMFIKYLENIFSQSYQGDIEALRANPKHFDLFCFYAEYTVMSAFCYDSMLSSSIYTINNQAKFGDLYADATIKILNQIKEVIREEEMYRKNLFAELNKFPQNENAKFLMNDFIKIIEDRNKFVKNCYVTKNQLINGFDPEKSVFLSRGKYIEMFDLWIDITSSFVMDKYAKTDSYYIYGGPKTPDINVLEYFAIKTNESLNALIKENVLENYIKNFEKNRLPVVGLFFNYFNMSNHVLINLLWAGEYEGLTEEQYGLIQHLGKLNTAVFYLKKFLRGYETYERKKEIVCELERLLELFEQIYPQIIDLTILEYESILIADKKISKMLKSGQKKIVFKSELDNYFELKSYQLDNNKSFSGKILFPVSVFKTLSNMAKNIVRYGNSYDDEQGNFKRIGAELKLRKKKILLEKLTSEQNLKISDSFLNDVIIPSFMLDDYLRDIVPEDNTITVTETLTVSFFGNQKLHELVRKIFDNFPTYFSKEKFNKSNYRGTLKRYVCTAFLYRFLYRICNGLLIDSFLLEDEDEKVSVETIGGNFALIHQAFTLQQSIKKTFSWDSNLCCTKLFQNLPAFWEYFRGLNSGGDEEKKKIYNKHSFKLPEIFSLSLKCYEQCISKVFDLSTVLSNYQSLVFDYLKNFHAGDLSQIVEKKLLFAAVIGRDIKKVAAHYGIKFTLKAIDEVLEQKEEKLKEIDFTFFREDLVLHEYLGFIIEGIFTFGNIRASSDDCSILSNNEALKDFVTFKNIDEIMILFSQMLDILEKSIPLKSENEYIIRDNIYGKMYYILYYLKINGGIEEAPNNFDELLLNFGKRFFDFTMNNIEAGGISCIYNEMITVLFEYLIMLVFRRKTSENFSERYFEFFQCLCRIKKTDNFYPTYHAIIILEYSLSSFSAEYLSATLENVVKGIFYNGLEESVFESLDLVKFGAKGINDYYPSAPMAMTTTVFKLCDFYYVEGNTDDLRIKLKKGQDISKLQLAKSKINDLEFPKKLILFLINNLYDQITDLINSWVGKTQRSCVYNFTRCYFSGDYLLKTIAILCSKYNLLIPIVEQFEIPIEKLEKDIKLPYIVEKIKTAHSGSDKIGFMDFLLHTITFTRSQCYFLFKVIALKSYTYVEQENGKIISSAKRNQIKYMNLIRKELLKACQPGFFKSNFNCDYFKEYIYLYAVFHFSLQEPQKPEWDKIESLKILKVLNLITEHLEPEASEIFLFSHFFPFFRFVYKHYLKLTFTEKTGKKYDKDLESVKYYLNKRINKGLLSNKSSSLLEKAGKFSLEVQGNKEELYNSEIQPKENCTEEEKIEEPEFEFMPYDDIIESKAHLSDMNYYIYSSNEMMSTSLLPFNKKSWLYGTEYYRLMMEQYKKGQIHSESIGKCENDFYNITFFTEFVYYNWNPDGRPTDVKDSTPIEIIFKEIYNRMQKKDQPPIDEGNNSEKKIDEAAKPESEVKSEEEKPVDNSENQGDQLKSEGDTKEATNEVTVKEVKEETKEEEKPSADNEKEKKNTFNFEEHGYGPDCLSLYGIDEQAFYSLTLSDQLEALQNGKTKLENLIIPYDFEAKGYQSNCLELYKIEQSAFDPLSIEQKNEMLQEARKKYDSEQAALNIDSRLFKKLLYKNLREKMEMGQIEGEETFELYNPADIEQIALHIKELEDTDKVQLYVIMNKNFRDVLPEEIKKEIIAGAPKQNSGILYNLDGAVDFESDFSNEERYEQDEEFIVQEGQDTSRKARSYLFGSQAFKKNIKAGIDNDDYFLELPMLSDKALFNLMRLSSRITDYSSVSYMYDVVTFLRDIQFNPVNATRIVDYIFFASKCSLYRLNGVLSYTDESHPLHHDNLVASYPLYDLRKPDNSLSAYLVEGLSYIAQQFLIGKRSTPLVLRGLYDDKIGLIFSENEDLPKLPQLKEFRFSTEASSKDDLFDILNIFTLTLHQSKINHSYETIYTTINTILDNKVLININKSIRPAYPFVQQDNNNQLRLCMQKILKCLSVAKKALKGKKALISNNVSTYNIIKRILISENSLSIDLLDTVLNEYIDNLPESTVQCLEVLNNIKKEMEPNLQREELADKILETICTFPDFSKKAEAFRIMIRDCMFLFDEVFNQFKIKKYQTDYKEWSQEIPNPTEGQLKVFNLKFKSYIDAEKSIRMGIFKKMICSNEKLNVFLKSTLETILFLNNLFEGKLIDEKSEKVLSIYRMYSYGIKALITIHDFINPLEDQEEEAKAPSLARLMTKETSEPEPKVNIARLARSYTQINNENISMSDLYNLLNEKSSDFVNLLIKQSGSRLNKYSGILMRFPNIFKLNFDEKTNFVVDITRGRAQKAAANTDTIYLNPDRKEVVNHSVEKFMAIPALDFALKGLHVSFQDEYGIDAGGLTREFLTLLVEEIVDPDFGLFQYASNGSTLQPNPNSFLVPDHLIYFNLLGRLIGKCIVDKKALKVHFVRSFLKHILGRTIYIKDLEDLDPILYQNLEWILENPIEGVLELTYSTEVDVCGHVKTVDLIPDGRNIVVTEDEKKDYLKKLCYYKMAESISQQTKALVAGLREIVPMTALKILDEKELSLLISGMPEIDIEDMKANAEVNLTDEYSNIAVWIWEVLKTFTQKELADFLFFVTGSSIVPVGGFKNFRIKLYQSYGTPESLPIGHTCYLQIDIPKYSSLEKLKEKLLFAINEGTGGFYIG